MSVAPAARERGVPSLSFTTLKRLSFAHSTAYACLLIVWLVPGLALGETVFGYLHGVGWILMVVLSLLALRARVITMRIAAAVCVLGAVAPFFGTWEFVREGRRRKVAEDPAETTDTTR
ncbi:unannotated protein [freshwater metagenome]|uniref:Unannotated protein n=1 Tax=freshwater metagenome TaxID=449393 RepID=A0A6J7E7N5_9ZZZZ|nr:hypothetical protein [Actinomycetota bacterium]